MNKDRLLIIDDELGPRESLRFLFKDSYDVICADSVDKGVEELRKQAPDCILSDIKMPEKNGIQGLREIRDIDPHVSIIMLTGYGSLDTAQEAIRHGATDYLKKPFDMKELRQAVAEACRLTQIHRKRVAAYNHLKSLNEQLREQLASKEELAALGEDSSEFVHDLSNPLNVISGYVELIMQDMKLHGTDIKENNVAYLEQIEKSTSRCRDMLKLWRERSRRQPSSMQTISVGELVEEVANNVQSSAVEKKARIIIEKGQGDGTVDGDNVQMFRAIQNIVRNAIEALPPADGIIRIGWRRDGRKVLVEVKDNGEGFPPEKMDELHQKYFTTKKQSGGMGLGLFITKNIVEAHGGSLTLVNNTDGRGACVTLALPSRTTETDPRSSK